MQTLKNVRTASRLALLLVGVAGLGLAGCDDHAGDPKLQIGANPVLPAVQQYLMPPMRVAKVVGWGKGNSHGSRGIAGPCFGDRLCASAVPLRPSQWRRAGG